jgi:3-oxoacyl-[acyl-carrier protein] reductase
MRVKDKVAIVTGGGSGIGEEIVLLLAKEGASVVVAEIFEERARKVARKIQESGGKALPLMVDVSNSKDVGFMVERTLDRFRQIDILVANAGILEPPSLLHEITEERWDRVTGVHFKGTFLSCKAVLPKMVEQRDGKIITFSSVGLKRRVAEFTDYIACKAGIEAMTRAMSVQYGPFNIRVNCVAPGYVQTPIWDAVGGTRFADEKALPFIPLGKAAKPVDIAKVVLFLVSEDANYISGAVIDVNGALA